MRTFATHSWTRILLSVVGTTALAATLAACDTANESATRLQSAVPSTKADDPNDDGGAPDDGGVMSSPDLAPAPQCIAAADCADTDPCTTDHCLDQACIHPPTDCSGTADTCNTAACDPLLGCVAIPLAQGTPCTKPDGNAGACSSGVCAAAELCQSGGSTVGGVGANCNGTWSCDLEWVQNRITNYPGLSGMIGREMAFQYHATVSERVRFTIHAKGGKDLDLIVLEGISCTSLAPVAGYSITTGDDSVEIDVIAGRWYTLVIDSMLAGNVNEAFDLSYACLTP